MWVCCNQQRIRIWIKSSISPCNCYISYAFNIKLNDPDIQKIMLKINILGFCRRYVWIQVEITELRIRNNRIYGLII